MSPQDEASSRRSVGLIVVHGIGDQRQGETAAKLTRGLGYGFGADCVHLDGADPITVRVNDCERSVRLYEVYWADILSGKAERNFDLKTLLALPWLPTLNRKAGLYGAPPPSGAREAVRALVVHAASAIFYFAYYGVHQLWNAWLMVSGLALMAYGLLVGLAGTAYHLVVALWYFLVALVIPLLPSSLLRFVRSRPLPVSRGVVDTAPRERRERRTRSKKRPWLGRHPLDLVLDAYLGDIFAYVRSLGLLETPVPGYEILACFHRTLRRACLECDEVQILAHSLGTVITYHGLTGYGAEPVSGKMEGTDEPLAKVTRLYTIGSPLEKIWRYWPTLLERGGRERLVFRGDKAMRAVSAGAIGTFRWDNFHNPLDLISDRLKGFEHWPGVTNHRVWGGGTATSHIIYESNLQFLSVIANGLQFNGKHLHGSIARSLWTGCRSVVESVAVLIMVATAVALGAVSGASAMYLTSRVIGWAAGFISATVASSVATWAFPVLGAGMVLAAFTLGRKQAEQEHHRWATLSPAKVSDTAVSLFVSSYKKFQLRDLEGAKKDLDRAIQLEPQFAQALVQRGLVHAARHEYEQAIKDYSEALRIDPDHNGVAWYSRGLVRRELSQVKEALDDFTQALRVDPTYAEAYFARGLARGWVKEYALAIEDFTAAIERDPKNDEAFHYRGVTLARLNDHERAIDDFTEAIRLNPRFALAYLRRGDAHAARHEDGSAQADYQKALAIDPRLAQELQGRRGAPR